MLSKLKWLTFQFAVAMLTFYWISTWADVKNLGIAPGIVSVFVAFVATGLLARFLDWRAMRGVVVSNEPQSDGLGLSRPDRAFGDGAKQIGGSRIGKDVRKLP